jgi:hypothetical protein
MRATLFGLPLVALMTACTSGSGSTTAAATNRPTPAGACRISSDTPRTKITLSYIDPQPRITALVGEVIEVVARWSAKLSPPSVRPSSAVCEFNVTTGHTVSADFVLRRTGHVTFYTSDATATDAMDPIFSGRVTVRNR